MKSVASRWSKAVAVALILLLQLLPAAPAFASGGTWSNGPNMSASRGLHSAVMLQDGKVLVAGGYAGAYLTSADLYDPNPVYNSWSAVGNMATARQNFTMTLLSNGKVLATGGFNSGGYVNSPEIYDPAVKTWSSTDPMPGSARQLSIAARLPDGRVIVAGGSSSSGVLKQTDIYNPTTGYWSTGNPMNLARVYHTGVTLSDGRIMVIGGGYDDATQKSAEIYDPASGNWSYTGSNLSINRDSGHSATLLRDGKVLVVGGYHSGPLASAEIWDPATNLWSTTTSNLINARNGPTATLMADGTVLIAGGSAGSPVLSSAEIYDPVFQTFSSAGNMSSLRTGHTATRLQNGKVLIAAGYSQPSQAGALNSSEFFTTKTSETVIIDDYFDGPPLDTTKFEVSTTGLGYYILGDWNGRSSLMLGSGYGGPGSVLVKSKEAFSLTDTSMVIFEGIISAYSEAHWYPGVYGDRQPRGLRVGTDPNNAIEFISLARDTVEARTVASGIATTTQYILPPGTRVERITDWVRYRIEATSSSVKFYVDNVQIATHTANIPTGSLNLYMGTSYSGGGNVPVGADWLYLAITTPPVTLTVNTTGQGSVAKNPDQATYTYGTVVTLTATPAPGWSFSSWGGDLSGNTNPTTITVNSNKAVTASFAVNTYVITASVGTNGSITPSGSVTVNSGAAQTFTISANTGYHVADVLVDGSSVGAVTSYTFNNVTANHTIAASFAINTYTPTPTPSPTTPTPTTSGGRSLPDPSSYVMVGSGLAAALLYLGVSRLRRRLNRSR